MLLWTRGISASQIGTCVRAESTCEGNLVTKSRLDKFSVTKDLFLLRCLVTWHFTILCTLMLEFFQ